MWGPANFYFGFCFVLFFIYIDDLASVFVYTKVFLFADSNLFSNGKDLSVLQYHINEELQNANG